MMNKKGMTGGVGILLSVVILLFTVGVLVMIFSLMGGEMLGTTNSSSQAGQVINDTTGSISGVTTWFPIIITLTAMVVLILLTVMIIFAFKEGGMMGDSSA